MGKSVGKSLFTQFRNGFQQVAISLSAAHRVEVVKAGV
jgi:hypothetical protein